MGKFGLGLLVVFLSGGCLGGGENDFSDCTIDALPGTWRIDYRQLDGTCGPVPSETGMFNIGAGVQPPCVAASHSISADRCRVEDDFTCPNQDGSSNRWVIVLDQVAEDFVVGSGTLQVSGGCRSTYDMTMTKL